MNTTITVLIRRIFFRSTFTLSAFACFALLPNAQAVVPAPDGGYPGGNTAEGQNALFSLTTGGFNTAVGYLSLRSNTTQSFNTALGAGSLFANNDGTGNTATGAAALLANTSGGSNTASGTLALASNTFGSLNTAVGYGALSSNSEGSNNTAVGRNALAQSATGHSNIALGAGAGFNVVSANGVIAIGSGVLALDVSNTTWIANIYGVTTQSGTTLPVVVSDQGQLGTTPSSARYKREIKPMDKASESILALTPVTFRYKTDKTNTPQFGLIAEEVAKVNPDLVVRDGDGEIYSVRYEQVNAMLLNEFLKEHQKVEKLCKSAAEQKKEIAEQHEEIRILTALLKAQAAQIQKVSARLELHKPARQAIASGR
jgi:hypothetical protein